MHDPKKQPEEMERVRGTLAEYSDLHYAKIEHIDFSVSAARLVLTVHARRWVEAVLEATSPRRLPLDELQLTFTGVTLFDFKNAGRDGFSEVHHFPFDRLIDDFAFANDDRTIVFTGVYCFELMVGYTAIEVVITRELDPGNISN